MNKIKLATATVAIGMIAGTAAMFRGSDAADAAVYRTAPITRGSLKATVSATGTLNAVRTVQVGTQVSGQIAKLYVDFNDHVKKGELLATIDPTLQQQAVQDAQAQLERAQATLDLAKSEYERNKQLFDAKVLSASEFATSESNFSVQEASVKSAQIALDRARKNLGYTNIYAPIDGVIVERNVDVGQTVAASLSAPQLFLIANDLSEMQILASVDEGDIGVIKEGLPVEFTVQAFPNQTFVGAVRQVRLQSVTTDNVVSYTAVVGVKNDGRLLPGMTATVKFVTATADSVLTVPSGALRVVATDAMKESAGLNDSTAKTRAPGDSTRGRAAGAAGQGGQFAGRGPGGQFAGRGQGGQFANRAPGTGGFGMLWTVDSTGKYSVIRVRTGLSDGQRTEVKSPKLHEGQEIIVSVLASGAAQTAPAQSTTNPLSPQRRGGRGF